MQSSSSEWQEAVAQVAQLAFEDGRSVLRELHSTENFARSLQLDVLGALVVKDEHNQLHDHLCLELGLTRHEAKLRVRIATALLNLRRIREAFRNGELDWNRLVLVTELAETPEDDELFATAGNNHSLSQLKVMIARKKAGDKGAVEKASENRSISFRHDDKKQESVITLVRPIDEGIAMEKATNERADSYGRDEATGEYRSQQHARSDAFVEIFFGDSALKAELLVDLEPAALVGDGKADLEGHAISKETLQRLACDASARASWIDGNGLPLALGRKVRLFPPWLSRQIAHRDRGCRFPGCGSRRWLHDHHMLEWEADHGSTDYNNGIQLCHSCHRRMHEGGWAIRGNPNEALTFISPDGKELRGFAPTLDPGTADVMQRMVFDEVNRVIAEREASEARREAEWQERRCQYESELEQRRIEDERRSEEARRRDGEYLRRVSEQHAWADQAIEAM